VACGTRFITNSSLSALLEMLAYRNICLTRETREIYQGRGKVQAVENKSRGNQSQGPVAETNQTQKPVDNTTSAWSYYLVRLAILSVTIAFVAIMVLFAAIGVFDQENSANITAALSSLFGIVGTLVGAYFGIKASSDAQDSSAATARQAVTDQKETSKDTAQNAANVASETSRKAAETAAETSRKAAETSQKVVETLQGAKGPSTMATLALATLIPVAGGASLLILRYYLSRMQNGG
jgi:hypothetical protein